LFAYIYTALNPCRYTRAKKFFAGLSNAAFADISADVAFGLAGKQKEQSVVSHLALNDS